MRQEKIQPRRKKKIASVSDTCEDVRAEVGEDGGCEDVRADCCCEDVRSNDVRADDGRDVVDVNANGEETNLNDRDEASSVSGDDCAVVNDEKGEEAEENEGIFRDDNEACNGEEEARDEEGEENEGNDYGFEEEHCDDLREHFGEAARDNEVDDSDSDSGDDIWNDETIPDPFSSDEEEEENGENGNHRNNIDHSELLALGKTFGCADDFKRALLEYSLKTRYDIKLYKSSSSVVAAKCSDTEYDCEWRIYCSYEKRLQKMQIKVYVNKHICVRSGYSKMLKRSTIASLFAERLRMNSKITKQEMVAEIKREYNLIVTDDQCGKAKSKLLREWKASHEAHFSRVWDYQAEILQTNEGTTMEIETVPGPRIGSKQKFYRLYVCFKAQREAWKQTCRPIIGLDGAFLKWDIKRHLLAAVGRDGDNRIVPLAWAVVEIKNDTNWDWFVRLLSQDLGLVEGHITVISDKQKGLVKAIHNVLPHAEHRMCAKHIMDNWKKDSNDVQLKRLFWKIARSYTIAEYDANLKALENYSPGAFLSLQNTNPPSWSRAFFRIGSCCNDNLNNLSESFNRTIRQVRKKLLLELLEDIRRQCMVRTAKRKIIANRLKTRFTKRAHVEIEKMISGATTCTRYMSTDDLHERDEGGTSYRVEMGPKTYGCRKWQMTRIPCIHAACVITATKQKVDDYVSDYYTTTMWRQTYKKAIGPVQGMKMWPRTNRLPVLPPPWRLGNRGRPSNYARRKGKNETGNKNKLTRDLRIITCSNCHEEGHNKLTCSNPRVESQAKRPRGRPRKEQDSLHERGSQAEASQGQGEEQASRWFM